MNPTGRGELNINDLTCHRRLLFPVNLEVDALVSGSADQSNSQLIDRNALRFIGIDFEGPGRTEELVQLIFGAPKLVLQVADRFSLLLVLRGQPAVGLLKLLGLELVVFNFSVACMPTESVASDRDGQQKGQDANRPQPTPACHPEVGR